MKKSSSSRKVEHRRALKRHPTTKLPSLKPYVPIVIKWLTKFDELFGLLFFMTLAWLASIYGFTHSSYFFTILFLAIKQQRKRQKKEELELMKKFARKERKRLITSSAEGSLWLNDLMSRLLPQIQRMVSLTLMQKAKEGIQEYLSTSKPPTIESIEVTDITLGTASPKLAETVTFHLENDFQTEFDLQYESDMRIVVTIKLGGRFINVPLPVAIQNLKVTGRMRLLVSFCESFPFVETVSFAFKYTPELDLIIKPLKTFDLMDITWIHAWLIETIQSALTNLLVLPNRMTINLQEKPSNTSTLDEKTEENQNKMGENGATPGKNLRKAVATTMFISNLKKKTNKKTVQTIPNGIIEVELVSACSLLAADSNGLSDPYALLSIGTKERKSKTHKKTLNPQWEETFEYLINFSEEHILHIEVKDWNKFGAHPLLGIYDLDFAPYCTESALNLFHEQTVALTLPDLHVKDDSPRRGTVTLRIRCQNLYNI